MCECPSTFVACGQMKTTTQRVVVGQEQALSFCVFFFHISCSLSRARSQVTAQIVAEADARGRPTVYFAGLAFESAAANLGAQS